MNHRAASEALLLATCLTDRDRIVHELDKAAYFEGEAVKHVETPRQRALGMGLLHAVDLMRAVTEAEFR